MRVLPLTMILAVTCLSAARGADEANPAAAASGVQVQVQVSGDEPDGETKRGRTKSTIVLRLGPDGTVELKDALPPDVQKQVQEAVEKAAPEGVPQADGQPRIGIKTIDIGGSITVIGPDGVARTQKFAAAGNGAAADLQGILGTLVEAAGADLPDGVAEQLQEALDGKGQSEGATSKDGIAAVVDRLDRILERLEKIERRLDRLKAAETSDDE